MTNGERTLGKYWEQIVEGLGSFALNTLHTIYTNLTIYNTIFIVIKYLPLILYMERYIRSTYKESQKRTKMRIAEIEDILLKLDIMNAKIPCLEAELREREETLRRCTEQLHMVRAQVRQVMDKSEDWKWRQQMKLPLDVLHLRDNKNSEEESKLFEELIKDCKYEQKEEPVDEISSDKLYDTMGFNGNTFNNNDEKRDYTIKIVKVTNIYKMSYLQHFLKHKRLQKARHALLKKKTNNTQKLFNDWHTALNAVTKRECVIDSETATGYTMGNQKSYEILHNTKITDESNQDNSFQIQNQCFTNGNYCEGLAPESEIVALDYTGQIYDNRHNYHMSLGDRAVLTVLPEETNSEIEIEILDAN